MFLNPVWRMDLGAATRETSGWRCRYGSVLLTLPNSRSVDTFKQQCLSSYLRTWGGNRKGYGRGGCGWCDGKETAAGVGADLQRPVPKDAVISAPALLLPLPFPDEESPCIDPQETFTPQFLPDGFYSQGKQQPCLTLSCSPALRRRALQFLSAQMKTPPFLTALEITGNVLFLLNSCSEGFGFHTSTDMESRRAFQNSGWTGPI